MGQYILPIIQAYPGWCLALAFVLVLAFIETTPSLIRAVRGGPFVVSKTVNKTVNKTNSPATDDAG